MTTTRASGASGNKLHDLITDERRAGIYVAPVRLAALEEAAKKSHLAIYNISLEGVHGKKELLEAVAKALHFPDWFGGNWDALEDSLCDFSWRHAEGYVLALTHCSALSKSDPQALSAALEVFDDAVEFWREQGKPFWVFVQGADAEAFGLYPTPE